MSICTAFSILRNIYQAYIYIFMYILYMRKMKHCTVYYYFWIYRLCTFDDRATYFYWTVSDIFTACHMKKLYKFIRKKTLKGITVNTNFFVTRLDCVTFINCKQHLQLKVCLSVYLEIDQKIDLTYV